MMPHIIMEQIYPSVYSSRADLVPPLSVTRASDVQGPLGSSAPLNQVRFKQTIHNVFIEPHDVLGHV